MKAPIFRAIEDGNATLVEYGTIGTLKLQLSSSSCPKYKLRVHHLSMMKVSISQTMDDQNATLVENDSIWMTIKHQLSS